MKIDYKQTVLITGVAGFIGYSVARKLLTLGVHVVGIDSFDPYYDVKLKEKRIQQIANDNNFDFFQVDITDESRMDKIFASYQIDVIIHLAAQAGVRYSIENPRAYIQANVVGTLEVLENSKKYNIKHLLIASTSSAYGGNTTMPFDELQKADMQMSLYAASKKATEVMSHSYSHLFKLPVTCFRFFTVYGPWGRPDMALFKFAKAIKENKPIDVYNYGKMKRDFTYIDDLVEAIIRLMNKVPDLNRGKVGAEDSLSAIAPWRVVNIGNATPVQLMDYISSLEKSMGKIATKNLLPMQPGDVPSTVADITLLKSLTNFVPQTATDVGVKQFVDWYIEYYD